MTKQIIAIVCTVVSFCALAIDTSDITMIDLTYTRSFHDRVNITIVKYSNGDVQLATTITPRKSDSFSDHSSEERVIDIHLNDINPIVNFYNNEKYIAKFRDTPLRAIMDGSGVRLEISMNGYSEVLTGQTIFSDPVGLHDKALANITLYILKLGEITIDSEALY